MKYYPKSKILENQHTSGREFVLKSNKIPYSGYYYILSNNTYYTGKSYEDENTEELIKIPQSSSTFISSQISKTSLPISYYPVPTDNDYKLGFITRYFLKRRNADYTTIIEISLDGYNSYQSSVDLNTSLYVPTKLNWRIGSLEDKNKIIDTNKKLVSFKENIYPGFSYYFNDYSQFSK